MGYREAVGLQVTHPPAPGRGLPHPTTQEVPAGAPGTK